jgi:hypothetical protein
MGWAGPSRPHTTYWWLARMLDSAQRPVLIFWSSFL